MRKPAGSWKVCEIKYEVPWTSIAGTENGSFVHLEQRIAKSDQKKIDMAKFF